MISNTLLKKEFKSNYKILLIFIAVLTMYEVIIVSMFNPELGETLDAFAKAMPEIMSAFGMANTGSTLTEFLSNYLYGFLLLVFPMILEIILANKLVAKYVDTGSMAYLLSTPNSRKKIVVTQGLFVIINIVILILYVTILGIICSEVMFPGDLNIERFILINISVLSIHIAISGICFFASCISNDMKLAYSIGAGVPIAFYIIQMLVNMGGKLEKLKYFTLFTLFEPNNIATGNYHIEFLIAAFIIGIVFYILGILLFSKRDLPL